MVGRWIRPWPGEVIVGYVYALEGDRLHCRASDGVEFYIELSDLGLPRGPELVEYSPPPCPPRLNSWGSLGMVPS